MHEGWSIAHNQIWYSLYPHRIQTVKVSDKVYRTLNIFHASIVEKVKISISDSKLAIIQDL